MISRAFDPRLFHAALLAALGLLYCSPLATLAADEPAAESVAKPRSGSSKEARQTLPQVAFINEQIRQGWAAHDLHSSPKATDGEWCRRVFLDVLGRIPTVAETDDFLAAPTGTRKVQLVQRLLGDHYADEYAKNWTTLWTNALIGRSGGTQRRDLINREGLQQSLREAMRANLPYDRLVYDLVSAKGVSKPGSAGFNGYVNYLSGNLDDNGVQATAKTAQLFLGLQVQCTQCHNHPFNDWKQNQFWELNAFFRQTRALRRYEGGRDVASIELINQDFAGENSNPTEAVLFYEMRNGLTKAAYPVFVDGKTLPSNSGYLDDVDRRTALAKLIMTSDYLGLAIANRMWAHFLGYGFTKPIDDMGPHNAPTHPELLQGLAQRFRATSNNLKELMRWIVLSEAYGLSSHWIAKNKQDDPTLGEKPMFSRFYMRQMRPEELYESLLVATEARRATEGYESAEAAKRAWLSQFTLAFGTDDNAETTTFNGTIPQTLMMMNGSLMNRATSIDKGSFLYGIANDAKLTNPARIQLLYMAAYSRKPTGPEIVLANELLVARKGDTAAAMQDIWWALLNSNEFILNH